VSRDYYWTLGIPNNATDSDIQKAYRQLAARWHPARNKENRLLAEKNFWDISEAFQVLANRTLRQMYDKHGRDGLLPDDQGIDFAGMVSHPKAYPFKEAMAVYREIFGGTESGRSTPAPLLYDDQSFEHSFPGFPRPATEIQQPIKSTAGLTVYKGYMFSGPTDDNDYRSVCVTTKVIDGRNIVTNRNVSQGVETVTVKEDGLLKSKTVDGVSQPLK